MSAYFRLHRDCVFGLSAVLRNYGHRVNHSAGFQLHFTPDFDCNSIFGFEIHRDLNPTPVTVIHPIMNAHMAAFQSYDNDMGHLCFEMDNIPFNVIRSPSGTTIHRDAIWWIGSNIPLADGVLLLPGLLPIYQTCGRWYQWIFQYIEPVHCTFLHLLCRALQVWEVIAFNAGFEAVWNIHFKCVRLSLEARRQTLRAHNFSALLFRTQFSNCTLRFKFRDLIRCLLADYAIHTIVWLLYIDSIFFQPEAVLTVENDNADVGFVGGGRAPLTVPASLLMEHTSWSE